MNTNLILKNFIEHGIYSFGTIFNKQECANILKEIKNTRHFGPSIFLNEEQYNQNTQHTNTNPQKGHSLLEKLNTSFITDNEPFMSAIRFLLGEDFVVVINKIICGVPHAWLPDYVAQAVENINVANLNPYIKTEYRDITHFRGIDYHQDMIDWPKDRTELAPETFITAYIYIHDVTPTQSPLHIMPGSHKLGASMFPHNLINYKDNLWKYVDDNNRVMDLHSEIITGEAGYGAMWHACTLHGTQPVKNHTDDMRLSIRLMFAKSPENKKVEGIDVINASVNGSLSMEKTRYDLDENGRALFKKNIIQNEKYKY